MLERALGWAEAGWPVFPCGSDKKPLIREWQKQATTDAAQIGEWWLDWPDALPAAVPGLVGCFALDVDVKNADGEASLRKLEAEHDFEAWAIPQQRTPSGGRHLLFRGHAATTRGVLGAGLDTRGGTPDGRGLGYIICYAETSPAAPDECPTHHGELVRAIGQPPERHADAGTPVVELDLPGNIKRCTDYLSRLRPVPSGGRNDALFRVVGVVKDLGVSEAKARELLAEHPAALGDPPLPEEEADATIRSAYANGQMAPGIYGVDPGTIAALAARLAADDPPAAPAPRTRRLAKWSERRSRPAPPWVVRHLIPKGALCGIYGPGGSYKSFLALDLALSIATARPQWGSNDVLSPGPVVYVSGEGALEPRVRAWEARYGAIPDTFSLLDGLALASADELLAMAQDVDSLIETDWKKPPVAVVVDTLARAAVGLDENSARDMGQIVQAANEIQRRYGCAVILVHHTPAKGETWRGSTAVFFALDTAISVAKTAVNRAVLSVDRQKDSAIGRQWSATLEAQETGVERDGEPEASLVVASLESKAGIEAGPRARRSPAQALREANVIETRAAACRAVLSGLTAGGTVSARALAKMAATSLGAGASEDGIRSWLRRAVKGGKADLTHSLGAWVAVENPLEFGPLVESEPAKPENE